MSVVDVMTPVPRGVWREVVAADPGAMVTQTPGWFDALLTTARAVDVSRLYLLEDGRRLVLPLWRRTPLPGLAVDESCSYGDLLATGGVRATDVGQVLADVLRHGRAVRTRLATHHGNTEQWAAGRPAGVSSLPRHVHVLDLEGGFGRVWSQRFDKPARRSVRRAERAGLTVERDLTGRLTTTFYAVYRAWIEDRARASGMPRWAADRTVAGRREPIELFEALAAELGEACRQWVAWYAGEPVAVNISLVSGAHAMTWRGFSRKELAAPLRANNLLQKLAIEDACSAGCRSYSMGQSGGVEGIERFKEGLGAIPRPAPEYQVERLPLTRLSEVRSHLRSSVTRALSPPRVHRG